MPENHGLFQSVLGGVLGLLGAATIVVYTHVNRRSRARGERAHWIRGWILGAAGMCFFGAGWTLLALAGPRVLPEILWPLGALLCLLALLIYGASARRVGRWRKPSSYSLSLHAEGIHARVRHPQALSLCVLVVGLVLLSGSLPILVTAPLWIAFWVFYTYLEESWELLPTFGEAYRRYRTSTPRLLPRIVPDRFRRSP